MSAGAAPRTQAANAVVRWDARRERYEASCAQCLAQFWHSGVNEDVWDAVAAHDARCQGRWWE